MRVASPTLVDLLRRTLTQLEQDSAVNPDDAFLRDLKSSIVMSIAELELKKENGPTILEMPKERLDPTAQVA